jgi:hypothetical protein
LAFLVPPRLLKRGGIFVSESARRTTLPFLPFAAPERFSHAMVVVAARITRRYVMRTLITATVASAFLLIPAGAYAQRAPQTTEAQQDLRDSVKAKHRTVKRQHILRSESNRNDR